MVNKLFLTKRCRDNPCLQQCVAPRLLQKAEAYQAVQCRCSGLETAAGPHYSSGVGFPVRTESQAVALSHQDSLLSVLLPIAG